MKRHVSKRRLDIQLHGEIFRCCKIKGFKQTSIWIEHIETEQHAVLIPALCHVPAATNAIVRLELVGQKETSAIFHRGTDDPPVQHAELLGLVQIQLKAHQEVLQQHRCTALLHPRCTWTLQQQDACFIAAWVWKPAGKP